MAIAVAMAATMVWTTAVATASCNHHGICDKIDCAVFEYLSTFWNTFNTWHSQPCQIGQITFEIFRSSYSLRAIVMIAWLAIGFTFTPHLCEFRVVRSSGFCKSFSPSFKPQNVKLVKTFFCSLTVHRDFVACWRSETVTLAGLRIAALLFGLVFLCSARFAFRPVLI